VFVFAIIFFGLYVFDESTGYTYYTRLERKLAVLERLHALEDKGIKNSPDLLTLHRSLVQELHGYHPTHFEVRDIGEGAIKFFSGSIVPFILLIWGLVEMLRKRNQASSSLFGGALALTLLLGVPALLIPTWGALWTNVVVYVAFQIVCIACLMWWDAAKRKKSVNQ